MIDSTKSPVPVWKRYATMVLLAVVILGAAYFIYTKDFRPSGGSNSTSTNSAQIAPPVAPPTTVKKAPPGPIGGLAISSRNPFS